MVFAPKDAATLQTEALEILGLDAYEGNEEVVDRLVASKQKDEDLKMSLHTDKTTAREKLKEARKLAGLDPETGEKIAANVVEPAKSEGLSIKDVVALRDMHEDDALWLAEEAKLRGKTVSEMKQDSYTQIILKAKADERKTAETTNTKTTGKQTRQSSEDIVKKAHDYKLNDDEMAVGAKATLSDMFNQKK